ncbi:leucine-rich repeat domain-containing protein [Mycetocola spongiae]|uniref:leucine-rich repeat domain-containing protein n=1 Tax=Mycetocola spongiae TaxID=2859226 RepID=UPI001CF1A0EE|nr:leucine-rich repeat domain-containing protein [Mycetocola spongiae]UCR89321.1 hypothetical protein KXZ72_01010 [Mycetocola spongiae]
MSHLSPRTRGGAIAAALILLAAGFGAAPALAATAATPATLNSIAPDAASGLGGTPPTPAPRPQPRAALPDDAELVTIPDAVLRRAIAARIGAGNTETLTRGQLRTVQSLTIKDAGLSDLTGLEYAANLDLLYIDNNQVSSLEPLRGLSVMRQITASRNPITDIAPLATLPNVNWLELNWTSISSLEPLRNNEKLSWLQIAYTNVTSLEPITGQATLTDINFQNTGISDLTPLAGIERLYSIAAPSAQISDLTPLTGLPRLNLLNVNYNHVTDLSMLDSWPNISTVGFGRQTVTGQPLLVPVAATEYRAADVVSGFRMAFGLTQAVSSGATPTEDGRGAIWSDVDPADTELEVFLSQPVVPGGPAFSATVTSPILRADFTTEAPPATRVDADYSFAFDTTTGFITDAAAGYTLTAGDVPGLTLATDGTLAGIATTAGEYPLSVRATDASGNILERDYTLVVRDAEIIPPTDPITPVPPVDPATPVDPSPVAPPVVGSPENTASGTHADSPAGLARTGLDAWAGIALPAGILLLGLGAALTVLNRRRTA